LVCAGYLSSPTPSFDPQTLSSIDEMRFAVHADKWENVMRRTPMRRANLVGMLVWLAGCSLLIAQDDGKVQSGPKKGEFMPKAFECVHINGPAKAIFVEPTKDQPGYHVARPRCLICQFGLLPSVLIFAHEPAEQRDEAFTDLLKKLDETATEFQDRNFSVGVVILSPDARDSTNNAAENDADKIIKETVQREKLIERLKKRAAKLEHVIIAIYPPDRPILREDPPKGYKLNPKAEITVLFYERMKIIENYAYAPGKLDSKHVDLIVKRVRDALPLRKNPAKEK
jgi:hypothetical protein